MDGTFTNTCTSYTLKSDDNVLAKYVEYHINVHITVVCV